MKEIINTVPRRIKYLINYNNLEGVPDVMASKAGLVINPGLSSQLINRYTVFSQAVHFCDVPAKLAMASS